MYTTAAFYTHFNAELSYCIANYKSSHRIFSHYRIYSPEGGKLMQNIRAHRKAMLTQIITLYKHNKQKSIPACQTFR